MTNIGLYSAPFHSPLDRRPGVQVISFSNMDHPCLACGACCAKFRVSFYWREASDETLGGVPIDFVEDLNQTYRAMKGTTEKKPRCIALEGNIGRKVSCSIYSARPTPCRNFEPSYLNGTRNDRCDRARAGVQLPPLRPEDWQPPKPNSPDLEPAA